MLEHAASSMPAISGIRRNLDIQPHHSHYLVWLSSICGEPLTCPSETVIVYADVHVQFDLVLQSYTTVSS